MVNKLIDGVSFLKSKFQTDELDEKLNQAVSQENWQASTQLLHQIANASYNYEKQQRILAYVMEKLKHKSWKKVLKTLHLVDFLLKYGPTSLINSFKQNIYEFRNFDNYTLVAQGIDRGQSIRKQSRVVVNLLSDDHVLSEERAKAKQIKDRMANVIGSAVYYGSFSNDGTSLPGSGPSNAKKESYESFNSSSFNKGGSGYGYGNNGSTGMTFGESVMKTLQQARKTQEKAQQSSPIPTFTQKPASKLNLSKMNERKPQQNKKTFNNLSMKLVKPPQKKPAEKKVEQAVVTTTTSNAPVVNKSKPASKVDIMDLDFLSFQNAPQSQPTQSAIINSNPSDNLNLLGAPISQPSKPQVQQPPPQQQQTANSLNFNLFAQNQPVKPQPQQNNFLQQPNASQANSNFLYSNPNNNLLGGFAYNQPTQPSPSFSFSQGPSTAPINIPISLSTPQQPKSEPNASTNLIDFSNFREELTQLGHQDEKKSIVEQWNW